MRIEVHMQKRTQMRTRSTGSWPRSTSKRCASPLECTCCRNPIRLCSTTVSVHCIWFFSFSGRRVALRPLSVSIPRDARCKRVASELRDFTRRCGARHFSIAQRCAEPAGKLRQERPGPAFCGPTCYVVKRFLQHCVGLLKPKRAGKPWMYKES